MSIAIHWFRRDLRLTDNTALNAAVDENDAVVPLYIVSEWCGEHRWCGPPRQEFLCECLASLARDLEAKGGRLIVRHGRVNDVMERVVREVGADAIYFNRDPDPYGREMEMHIEKMAQRIGVKVRVSKDIALHERDEVLTGSGTPFRVFTPYARAWLKLAKDAPGNSVGRLQVPRLARLSSEGVPTLATWGLASDARVIAGGENAARERLSRFLDGPVLAYDASRNFPAMDGTSRLSQDLRWGLLSIREVFAACQSVAAKARSAAHRRAVDVFVNELIWREFYMQVLWFHPDVLEREYQDDCRKLPWKAHWRPGSRSAGEAFQRWCQGETGFPIVDAGMRELNATGFMHNRVRMIVAMFLTKDLHLWWMHGESYFMQRLVDGEIASNNGGWQWSASTGTDAAPYFRIQNPWSQSKRFDPDGEYIKRWIPELQDVAARSLANPPDPGRSIAKGYPKPMVQHDEVREEALEMFRGKAPR